MVGTFSDDDWIGLFAITAVVFTQAFGIHRLHANYWTWIKCQINQENISTFIPIPTAWLFTAVWVFMWACIIAGSFIYWQLIPAFGTIKTATMALFFSHVIIAKFWPIAFFESRSRWFVISLTIVLACTAAAITVLSGIDAHKFDPRVYATTALWGFYTAWLIVCAIMMLPMSCKLESLCIIDENPGCSDYGKLLKLKQTTKTTLKYKTSGGGAPHVTPYGH